MPLHLSASGKAILSMRSDEFQAKYLKNEAMSEQNVYDINEELVRAKRLGYSLTHGEIDAQISCIAAPILNLRNEPVAAISAVINSDFISVQDARVFSKNLIQAARQLSSRII